MRPHPSVDRVQDVVEIDGFSNKQWWSELVTGEGI
jgi:hypothetical protein